VTVGAKKDRRANVFITDWALRHSYKPARSVEVTGLEDEELEFISLILSSKFYCKSYQCYIFTLATTTSTAGVAW